MRAATFAVTLLPLCAVLVADDEASNSPYVAASRFGGCYAKSVPAERYGSKGTTTVHYVGAERDHLAHTFDWYANPIYLECIVEGKGRVVSASVVQTGPWARGGDAMPGHLALAFHHAGKLVKKYSTLDIAGDPRNVRRSTSHYTVIKEVLGYRWTHGNSQVFEAIATDGRKLVFDGGTGELISGRRELKPRARERE